MPAIAWLAMHPPRDDVFPWWTGYALDVAGAIILAMLGFMTFVYAGDAYKALRERWKKG